MYTQIKQTLKPTIPVFLIAGEPDPSEIFVAGKCICKLCRSKDLTFYRYLDDAKCSVCKQWQNEPITD